MTIRRTLFPLLLLTALLCGGFRASAQSQPSLLDPASVSGEAKTAAMALVLRMRGEDLTKHMKGVAITPEADAALSKPFRYTGFALTRMGFDVDEAGAGGKRRAAGVLVFEDGAGRGTAVTFFTDYVVNDAGLTVENASIQELVPRHPKTRLVFVPRGSIDLEALAKTNDYAAYVKTLLDHAVSLQKADQAPRAYHAFLLVSPRTYPDALFGLLASDLPEGLGGLSLPLARRSFDGWMVLRADGTFQLGGGSDLFFKVIYRPGSDAPEGERTPRLVNVFDNRVGATPPEQPQAEFFIIPSDRVTTELFLLPDPVRTREKLSQVALPLGNPRQLPTDVGTYTVFALVRHGRGQQADMNILVSSKRDGGEDADTGASVADHEGWSLLSFSAAFAMNTGPEVFFKLRYDVPSAGTSPRVLNILSNHPK